MYNYPNKINFCERINVQMSKTYLGVVQLTPLVVLFALVVRLFPSALKAQKNSPGRLGRFSITSCRVLKYI